MEKKELKPCPFCGVEPKEAGKLAPDYCYCSTPGCVLGEWRHHIRKKEWNTRHITPKEDNKRFPGTFSMCDECGGSGVIYDNRCKTCGGTGDSSPMLSPSDPEPSPCGDCKGSGLAQPSPPSEDQTE